MSERASDLLLTRANAAALLRMSARNFDEQIRPKLESGAVVGEGKSLRFKGDAVVAAFVSHRAKPSEIVADPLLAGGDSPGLERYRNARADLAEMERDRMRGRLIPRDQLEPAMAQFSAILRRAGESIQRQYGNDPALILNEAVDEWIGSVEALLSSDARGTANANALPGPEGGGTDPPSATADDAGVR